MTKLIFCERCWAMMPSTSYRVLWIVVFLLLAPGFLIFYLPYCLCRSKRVCQNCKCRVKPFESMEDCQHYYTERRLRHEEKERLKAERKEQKKLE